MPHGSRIPRIPAIPGAPGPGQGGAPRPTSPFQHFTGRAPTSLDALRLLQAGGTQTESKRLLREAAGLPQQRQGVGAFGGVASTQPVTPRRGGDTGRGGTPDIFRFPKGEAPPARPGRPGATPGLPSSGEVIGSRFRRAFARRPFLF